MDLEGGKSIQLNEGVTIIGNFLKILSGLLLILVILHVVKYVCHIFDSCANTLLGLFSLLY